MHYHKIENYGPEYCERCTELTPVLWSFYCPAYRYLPALAIKGLPRHPQCKTDEQSQQNPVHPIEP
jgi:hypothetical protein